MKFMKLAERSFYHFTNAHSSKILYYIFSDSLVYDSRGLPLFVSVQKS